MKNIFLLALIISVTLFTAACKKTASEISVDGKIDFIIGSVTLNGRPAVNGDMVKLGDIIDTGDSSNCKIIIAEKNLLSIGKKTRVIYKIKQSDSALELPWGWLGGLIRNRKAIGDLKVIMPTVTASIRGTVFCIVAEGPDKTYTCACNGHIHFKPSGDGTEELISASHHSANYYTRKNGSIAIEKAGLKYHTDESTEQMAKIIGETIDWKKTE
jgi:hypothetical protein